MFMLKRTHDKAIEFAMSEFEMVCNEKEQLKNDITKLQDFIKIQDKAICEKQDRLANAVEGLSDKDKRILRAKQEGNFIYTITFGGKTLNIEIPMSSSNCARTAKRKALAKWGLGADYLQLCEAERWVI